MHEIARHDHSQKENDDEGRRQRKKSIILKQSHISHGE